MNNNQRGKYPIGVNYNKITYNYIAQIRKYGKSYNLGSYSTEGQAHEAWRKAKIDHVAEVVLAEFMAGNIKTDVYLALVRRTF